MNTPNCVKLLHAIFLLLLLQVESVMLASSGGNTNANISCIEKERRALLKFKQGFVDDYGILSSWGKDADCCKWSGIQCNNLTGHVERLDLQAYGGTERLLFAGEIRHCASLMDLHHLNYLDLSWNDFDGNEIPELFGSLAKLEYLDLNHAFFGGEIPYQLGKLSSLQLLNLESNNLVGAIPWQLGNLSSLQVLALHENNLGGIIPDHLGNLSSLDYLVLSNNYNLKIDSSAQWISHLSSLSNVELDGVSSLNNSKHWVQMVLQLPKLEQISLKNCNLSDIDILPLSTYRSNSSMSITFLGISLNSLTSSIFTWVYNLSSNLALLELDQNLLQGPIPDDFGRVLKSLKTLFLWENQLNGSIPKSFRLMSQLQRLDVGTNSLEGVITEIQFANFTDLLLLCLSDNAFTVKFNDNWIPPFQLESLLLKSCMVGPNFPNWLQTQNDLAVLDLSDAGISYTAGLASYLCAAGESIGVLFMADNNLSGQIPNCWGHLKFLRILDLSNNTFSGNIPTSMTSLVLIHHLILRTNQLTGKLPSLENCTELILLDVGGNQLSEPIPLWIGSLQQLQVLNLRKNHFYGSLSQSLCHLNAIQVLDLSQNNLSGELPKCLKNFSAMGKPSVMETTAIDKFYTFYPNGTPRYNYAYDFYPLVTWKGKELSFKDNKRLLNLIDLSSNHLSGKIPTEIGDLVELISLDLSSNNLSGQIPSQFGNLHSLDFLNLSKNHLFGKIPSSLSKIDRLGILDLSNNNLSGKIPTGTQLQSFNASSYEGNAFLCGNPLKISCPEDKTNENPSFPRVYEENHEDLFFTKGFYISMGLGFFTGFWGIFGSLLLFRSWRHAYFNFVNNLMDRIYVMIMIKLARSH